MSKKALTITFVLVTLLGAAAASRRRPAARVLSLLLLVALALAAAPAVAQTVRAFHTSTTYTADLVTEGAAACGGSCADAFEAGDAICNSLAAGLGGQWIVFLSTSTTDGVDRLTPGSGPFITTGPGNTIAADIASLTTTPVAGPIDYDEAGNPFSGTNFAWTGSKIDGTVEVSGNHCTDWTNASTPALGRVGRADITTHPFDAGGDLNCSVNTAKLLCFEVPAAPTPGVSPMSLGLMAGLMMLLLAGSYLFRHRDLASAT